MNNSFQPIKLLQNAADERQTGHLQIIANDVTWNIYLVEGMLEYADHSLQFLSTVQHYLLRHNQEEATRVIPTLAKNIPPRYPLVSSILKQLKKQQYLTTDEFLQLRKELIEDALESCLWLRKGNYRWYHEGNGFSQHKNIKQDNLLSIFNLLNTLTIRLKSWQKFSPLITSPHQRLFCANPDLIQQNISSGNLNPTSLEKLVKLMQGKTLRQISLFLKQDELNVAQLLFPYLKNNILQLKSPETNFAKLPLIPSSTSRDTPNKPITKSQPRNSYQGTQMNPEKTYKVVCIDDSPTILEMIKNYLEQVRYEVLTVDNPTQSLPCLFKHKPDLILIDFSMPGINGNKLCRIIKASSFFKKTPIIMISGNSKMLTPENIQAAGATDYLAKPFTKEVLQQMVNKYLLTDAEINQQITTTNTSTNTNTNNTTNTDTKSPVIPIQKHQILSPDDFDRKPIQIARKDEDIDSITGLPNSQCFERYLSDNVKNAEKTGSSFSIMTITINNFTNIKDTLGETQGDRILHNVARQIQSVVRASDVIARRSDNEFVIVFNQVKNQKILAKISQRILESIEPSLILSEHQLSLELSHTVKIHSLLRV